MRRVIDETYVKKLLDCGFVLALGRTAVPGSGFVRGSVTSGDLSPAFDARRARSVQEFKDIVDSDWLLAWPAVDLTASGLIAIVGHFDGAPRTCRYGKPVAAQLFRSEAIRVCEYAHEHRERIRAVSGVALPGSWLIGDVSGTAKALPEGRAVTRPRFPQQPLLIPLDPGGWASPPWQTPPAEIPRDMADRLEELSVQYHEKSANSWRYHQPEIIPEPGPEPKPPTFSDFVDCRALRLAGPASGAFGDWLLTLGQQAEDFDAATVTAVRREAEKIQLDPDEMEAVISRFIEATKDWRRRWHQWNQEFGWVSTSPPKPGLSELSRQAELSRHAMGDWR